MIKTFLLSVFCLFLVGCKTIEPSVVTKEKLVPVVIDKRLLEVKPLPKPSMTRSELKELNEKEFISWQSNFIAELMTHIKSLNIQITGIDKAIKIANEEVKKGNR